MKKAKGLFLLCTVFILCFIILPSMSEAQKKPIVLKGVTGFAKQTFFAGAFFMFQDRVNKELKEELNIIYAGGPEAIPPFEQIEAVRKGLADLAVLPGAFYVPQVPEIDALKLSELMAWEERKTGAYDFLREIVEKKANAFYIGRVNSGVEFFIYTNVLVKKADFTGLKIRVTPIYEPFVRALGGVPMTTAPGEVYTALEQKVVDGYGWPSLGVMDLGWHEVTKYVIDHGFYQTEVGALINLDTWKKLPESVQKRVKEIMLQVEKDSSAQSMGMVEKERKVLKDKGLVFIKLPPPEDKKYIETAYRVGWEKVIARSPEFGSKLKTLLKK
jgi:TRAP-type C4-dicarboxylate transport system substrate-binding protein